MLKEFKEFAMRGNVVDLAVGVIIGAAFGKIVTSLTNDLVLPIVGLVLGDGDYATLQAATEAGAPVFKYGVFMNTVLDFVILAWIIFLMVRTMNRLKKAEPPPPPPGPSAEAQLLAEIRDVLKSR
jgi:large conductance mechanosensitive channel